MPQTPEATQIPEQVRTQAEQTLRSAEIPDEAKAQAWDAFMAGSDPQAFREGINGVPGLTGPLKRQLLTLRFPEQVAAKSNPQATPSGRDAAHPPQTPQSQSARALSMIPAGPPGADHRPQGMAPLPDSYRPDSGSLWDALTTPLTEQFHLSPREGVAQSNRAMEAALPAWMRPAKRLASGVDEAALGAAEQLTAPLSILLAPLGAMSEAAEEAAPAVRLTKRALGVIGGAASASDAAGHVYSYFKTGDTGELGKAFTDTPFAILGGRAGIGKRPGQTPSAEPRVSLSGEAEPVSPPDYSVPGPPRVGAGAPEPRRISNIGQAPRQLEAPSATRTALEHIAQSAGPFKSQVYEWARKPLGEIQQMREQAQKNLATVERQFRSENAPFSGANPPVTNISQAVPKGSASQIPQGKGEFTAGGPRVLLDRARAQYEALDKIYQVKASEAGILYPPHEAQAWGRPIGPRALIAGPGGPHEPPPGAITIQPIRPDYQTAGVGTGRIPPSRQLAEPELRVLSPELSLSENLQAAKDLPQEVLAHNIEQMQTAAAQHASDMVQKAGKDPAKLQQVKVFIEQAKARLDQFQKVYDETYGEKAKTASAPPGAEDKAPASAPGSSPGPTPGPAPNGTVSADEATIAQHISDQIDTAKGRGLKVLKLTIYRGAGAKPMVVGINPEFDTPEELAAQIVKQGGASGMAQIESTDPERPVQWKFLIGDAPAPPGSK